MVSREDAGSKTWRLESRSGVTGAHEHVYVGREVAVSVHMGVTEVGIQSGVCTAGGTVGVSSVLKVGGHPLVLSC